MPTESAPPCQYRIERDADGPTLVFIHGERKRFMLHSNKWLRTVAEPPGQAEGLAKAGHWLMETHADPVNGKIPKIMDTHLLNKVGVLTLPLNKVGVLTLPPPNNMGVLTLLE
ncbi:MAG: hypothetical protein RQ826_07915 [Xanthomonadales bacterium]|nr:hypothetical protein [Xanthomonadales bacterium]